MQTKNTRIKDETIMQKCEFMEEGRRQMINVPRTTESWLSPGQFFRMTVATMQGSTAFTHFIFYTGLSACVCFDEDILYAPLFQVCVEKKARETILHSPFWFRKIRGTFITGNWRNTKNCAHCFVISVKQMSRCNGGSKKKNNHIKGGQFFFISHFLENQPGPTCIFLLIHYLPWYTTFTWHSELFINRPEEPIQNTERRKVISYFRISFSIGQKQCNICAHYFRISWDQVSRVKMIFLSAVENGVFRRDSPWTALLIRLITPEWLKN